MKHPRLWLSITLLLLAFPLVGHLYDIRFTDTSPLTTYQHRPAFCLLSHEQQHNYHALYEAISQSISADCTVRLSKNDLPRPGIAVVLPYPLTNEAEAHNVYNAIVRDNPQFFFLSPTYGFEGNEQGEKTYYTELKLVYYMEAAQRTAAAEQLETLCSEWLSSLPEGDDFDRELFLHDKLLAQCAYADEMTEGAPLSPSAYSIYGALIEGRAVCEGYSRALQYLLEQAEISATVVTGKTPQQRPHMWNIVVINGETYHVDATGNDASPYPQHAYFNLSDQQLPYTPDESVAGAYSCTATADNYYRRTNRLLTTFRQEDIARYVARQILVGNSVVEWRCLSEETYTNALFFLQSDACFRETVNAFLPAGFSPLTAYTVSGEETLNTLLFYKKQ